MISVEYANAYSEVLEILKYISKEDYEKIPNSKPGPGPGAGRRARDGSGGAGGHRPMAPAKEPMISRISSPLKQYFISV